MKFPEHIILDVNKPKLNNSRQYWIFRFLSNYKNKKFEFMDLSFHRTFLLKKEKLMLNSILKKQKLYTVRYNKSNPAIFLTKANQDFYKKTFAPRPKVKHKDLFSKHFTKRIYDYLIKPTTFDEKSLFRLFLQPSLNKKLKYRTTTSLWSLFDINFLKKEKIYTKLKYSRVPQYDIVSGGSAALLAGFLGFLICEKFGFEMLDSGDFYYLFMYIVFLTFTLRPLLRIIPDNYQYWTPLSLKLFFIFYKTTVLMFIKKIKNFYNKIKIY